MFTSRVAFFSRSGTSLTYLLTDLLVISLPWLRIVELRIELSSLLKVHCSKNVGLAAAGTLCRQRSSSVHNSGCPCGHLQPKALEAGPGIADASPYADVGGGWAERERSAWWRHAWQQQRHVGSHGQLSSFTPAQGFALEVENSCTQKRPHTGRPSYGPSTCKARPSGRTVRSRHCSGTRQPSRPPFGRAGRDRRSLHRRCRRSKR